MKGILPKENYSYLINDENALVSIDITRHANGYDINRVYVPPAYRGKGYARKGLEAICSDADKCNVTLFLDVNAYGEMSRENLIIFYKSLGFSYIDISEEYEMIRKPFNKKQ